MDWVICTFAHRLAGQFIIGPLGYRILPRMRNKQASPPNYPRLDRHFDDLLAPSLKPSLVSQKLHRIQPCRRHRGVERCEEANGNGCCGNPHSIQQVGMEGY